MIKTAILITCFILIGCHRKNEPRGITNNKKIVDIPGDSIPVMAKKLIENYKNYISSYSNNYLIFKDSSKLVWDDGKKNKSFQEVLNNPDVEDMFSQTYLKGVQKFSPVSNYDPGRVRNEMFFRKIYGNTEMEVKNNLKEIVWCPNLVGQKIKVTSVNGVDKKLIQISMELDKHPELKKYIFNIGGTFKWRMINGTNRQSMHSFGMTIDLNVAYSNYWQWDCRCTNENSILKYRNQIPQIIVDIFEKHGFIWGGKWYHYDSMHFEYRPELF
jgi:hypothetical protein